MKKIAKKRKSFNYKLIGSIVAGFLILSLVLAFGYGSGPLSFLANTSSINLVGSGRSMNGGSAGTLFDCKNGVCTEKKQDITGATTNDKLNKFKKAVDDLVAKNPSGGQLTPTKPKTDKPTTTTSTKSGKSLTATGTKGTLFDCEHKDAEGGCTPLDLPPLSEKEQEQLDNFKRVVDDLKAKNPDLGQLKNQSAGTNATTPATTLDCSQTCGTKGSPACKGSWVMTGGGDATHRSCVQCNPDASGRIFDMTKQADCGTLITQGQQVVLGYDVDPAALGLPKGTKTGSCFAKNGNDWVQVGVGTAGDKGKCGVDGTWLSDADFQKQMDDLCGTHGGGKFVGGKCAQGTPSAAEAGAKAGTGASNVTQDQVDKAKQCASLVKTYNHAGNSIWYDCNPNGQVSVTTCLSGFDKDHNCELAPAPGAFGNVQSGISPATTNTATSTKYNGFNLSVGGGNIGLGTNESGGPVINANLPHLPTTISGGVINGGLIGGGACAATIIGIGIAPACAVVGAVAGGVTGYLNSGNAPTAEPAKLNFSGSNPSISDTGQGSLNTAPLTPTAGQPAANVNTSFNIGNDPTTTTPDINQIIVSTQTNTAVADQVLASVECCPKTDPKTGECKGKTKEVVLTVGTAGCGPATVNNIAKNAKVPTNDNVYDTAKKYQSSDWSCGGTGYDANLKVLENVYHFGDVFTNQNKYAYTGTLDNLPEELKKWPKGSAIMLTGTLKIGSSNIGHFDSVYDCQNKAGNTHCKMADSYASGGHVFDCVGKGRTFSCSDIEGNNPDFIMDMNDTDLVTGKMHIIPPPKN